MNSKKQILFAICIWLVAALPSSGFSQTTNPMIDSMEASLDTLRSDSLWAETYIKVCLEKRKTDLTAGAECLQKGLAEARQRGYQTGIARFLQRLGFTYELMGNYVEEMSLYMEALHIFEKMSDSSGIANSYNALGNLYNSLSDYEIALEYHLKALKLRSALRQESMVAGTYNNIGNTFLSQSKYKEAEVYYRKAVEINERNRSKDFLSSNYSNLGLVQDGLHNSEEAVRYHERALELREKTGNQLAAASSRIYMGIAYAHLHENEKAIALLREGMEVVKANDAKSLMERGYFGLYEAHKARGEFKEALEAHEHFRELSDSLRSDEVAGKVARAQIQLQTERQERERELMAQNRILEKEAELERTKWVTRVVVGVIAFILLIVGLVAVLFGLRYRSKKRSEAILEQRVQERTEDLARANEELGKFIYQSSHDMRSPLTSIKGLVSLALTADPGQERQYIDLIMGRVNHLDGVYTGLIEFMNVKERVPNPVTIDLDQLKAAVLAHVEQKRGDGIMPIHFDFAACARLVTDELLLRTILQNLLLNAIDFRDKPDQGQCNVRLQCDGRAWELQVVDDGTGMDANFLPKAQDMFVRGSNKSKGSGLGLYTAKLAATKLGGRLILESEVGRGTTVSLRFPAGIS